MPSSTDLGSLSTLVELVAVLFLVGYAGYWALSIRRALFVRLYRGQALAVSVAAAATSFIGVLNLTPREQSPGATAGIQGMVGPILVAVFFMGLFYMVDATVMAGRLSDPLLRDTLRWTRVRKVLWGLNVICVILTFVTGIFFLIFTFFLPIVSGALLFPVLARRTGDATLRRHLRWLGIFFVFFFISAFEFFGNLTLSGALLAISAYFLYRSARSLAPLNRIDAMGLGPSAAMKMGAVRPKPSLFPRYFHMFDGTH